MLSIPFNVWYGGFADIVLSDFDFTEENKIKHMKRLYELYSEPHRKYHNSYHPWWIFTYSWENEIVLTKSQLISILYHDAIYEIGSPKGENEKKSAELLKNDFGYHKNIPIACNIIRDTATHFDTNPIFTSEQSALVLDLDIINMSLNWNQFLEWNSAVECEFKNSDPLERLEFLRFFVSKDNILHSDELKHKESDIRKNINKLIDIKEHDILNMCDEEYDHYNNNFN